MRSWIRFAPIAALLVLPSCLFGSPGGELGVNGRLRFATDDACFGPGCDQLRGIAVGDTARIGVTDDQCGWSEGAFEVAVSGEALEIVGAPSSLEREEDRCWTYVTVRALAEGSGTLRAVSPSGGTDSYALFGAVPTTVTATDGYVWSSRADARRFELEVGDLWWSDLRVTDAMHRPLVYDRDAVRWESADPAVVGPPELDLDVLQARSPGETTLTGRYGDLSVTVGVVVVEP